MSNSNKMQFGYFIDIPLWKDALKLLRFQIEQKKKNRHFNTLSMFYYEEINADFLDDDAAEYFKVKISSNLFYGLKKEFSIIPYVIPKLGLGLRDYKFFTYPMRVVYYSVGLYLLKLSQEFLTENYKKNKRINAFYGGDLSYKEGKLYLTPNNIYYRSFHQKFKSEIEKETRSNSEYKIILQLDIENYFNELSILKLLQFLDHFIKPSLKSKMNYDIFTREQMVCFFQFMSTNKAGIPQLDNSIISSFIGYLYLVFGDLFIDDILVSYKNESIIDSHKIIRYTDDIYISIMFNHNINKESQSPLIELIASQIAEILYSRLELKLNMKTKLYRLSEKKEKEELLKNIRRPSPNNEYFTFIQDNEEEEKEVKPTTPTPQHKLDNIFKELRKIKKSRVEDYLIRGDLAQKEILQEVFEKSVEEILNKPDNKNEIKKIFTNFEFNLVKVQPLAILIILLKDKTATDKFREFCLKKSIITTGDADLIIQFLRQTDFKDEQLISQLKNNPHLSEIVDLFIDKKLNCEQPGYYNLGCIKMKKLSDMPEVVEQIRLRIVSERNQSYSVALNHLVNEIHAVCINQSPVKKKNYDVNDVVNFLYSKGVPNEKCIKIRNLFDRRNFNSVSHPGSDERITWAVTREEYLEYYDNVGQCLEYIL
jgi:AbiA family abortive infection protein